MGLAHDEWLERAQCQRFMRLLITYCVINDEDYVISFGKIIMQNKIIKDTGTSSSAP